MFFVKDYVQFEISNIYNFIFEKGINNFCFLNVLLKIMKDKFCKKFGLMESDRMCIDYYLKVEVSFRQGRGEAEGQEEVEVMNVC